MPWTGPLLVSHLWSRMVSGSCIWVDWHLCLCLLMIQHANLVAILKVDPKSEVHMPDAAEIALLKEAISAKHSLLVDCYCMVDGLKLYLQQAGDSVIQSHFYNGWKHDHYVTNIFAFVPNGSIIACTLNAPGTWHDSTLAHWGPCIPNSKNVGKITMGKC